MLKALLKRKELNILFVIIFISILLTFVSDSFLTVENLMDVLRTNAVYGIMALGMLPVLITGGIDISVSATIAFSAVVVGNVLVGSDVNIVVAFLIGTLSGALIGFINGLLITKLKIAPMIVTLGMSTIVLGLVLLYTGGVWISGLPKSFIDFGQLKLFAFTAGNGREVGLPTQVIILIVAAAITAFVLKHTVIGRGIYAIGGSETSATRVGFNVDKIKIFVYTFCGLMTGLASVVHTSIVQQVDPNSFTGYELTVITTAVLGGASSMGGVGTVFGTILGILLMGILQNGLILAKIPTFWQKIVMGFVIIFAVSFDIISRNREKAKLVRVDLDEDEEAAA